MVSTTKFGMFFHKYPGTPNSTGSLSGWWFQPLWKILVSWDCYSQYIWKNKKLFQTTNQFSLPPWKSMENCHLEGLDAMTWHNPKYHIKLIVSHIYPLLLFSPKFLDKPLYPSWWNIPIQKLIHSTGTFPCFGQIFMPQIPSPGEIEMYFPIDFPSISPWFLKDIPIIYWSADIWLMVGG